MKTKRQIADKPFLGFLERSVMSLKAAEVECIAFFYDSPPPCRLKEEFSIFLRFSTSSKPKPHGKYDRIKRQKQMDRRDTTED